MSGDDRGIGVVGAGPAGLAAAWRLAATGRRVRVYEASRQPGGRMRTEQVAGSGADVGVQLLSAGYDRFLDLVSDLGLRDRLVAAPGRDAVWRAGRAHPLRYGSITSLATSGAIPARLKVRLAMRYVPFLERHGRALDLNEPVSTVAAGLDEESIAAWGRRELGDDFVEYLVYPLLAAYYNVTPEETSAGLFHALARSGMRVTVLGAMDGAGALMAAVGGALEGRGVEIALGWPVSSIEPTGSGVAIRGDGGDEAHDAVVVATPAPDAARLVPGIPWLESIDVRSTATLVLALREPLRTGWFGLSIPRVEDPGAVISAICVQEEKGTAVVAADRGALVVLPAPTRAEHWSTAEPAEVLETVLPAVESLLPGIRGRIVEARLVRWPAGGFVPVPGYFQRLSGFDHHALPSRVALAGDYLVGPTVEGAVRAGLAAADRISRAGW